MDFVEFVVKYWKYISIGLVIFCNLLLFILKKKPVKIVDSITECLLLNIPVWIDMAELTGEKGQTKLDYVLDLAKKFLEEHFPDANYFFYESAIKEFVEDVLSTPQKKGVQK